MMKQSPLQPSLTNKIRTPSSGMATTMKRAILLRKIAKVISITTQNGYPETNTEMKAMQIEANRVA